MLSLNGGGGGSGEDRTGALRKKGGGYGHGTGPPEMSYEDRYSVLADCVHICAWECVGTYVCVCLCVCV